MITKDTGLSIGLAAVIFSSVVWLTRTAWSLEKAVGERMHQLETKDVRLEEHMSAVVDRLDVIAVKLDSQVRELPDLKARVEYLDKRIMALEANK